MTSALIADDEALLAEHLKEQLTLLWPELKIVHMARNGIEAAQKIAELQPDLAFLDVEMPGLDGLEVAQGIEGETRVVFVTAYDEYAVQAFDHAALDYLLKPLKQERLARTLERVKLALAAPPAPDAMLAQALQRLLVAPAPPPQRLRYVRAAQGLLTHQVAVADVIFFHADDKYTVVTTAAGEHLIRTPIAELASQLDPDQFWQVHRATLINLDFLAGTRRDELSRLYVRLTGHDTELPVSRAFVHLFKAM
ncbi:LytTR family DNA-binding domain-containing protein [Massilia sp. P8910]|uniref:LytR/AlgR family response regulator transcription factor n=1 Tax=Massilia antarctica TaxID=2765360 RepID=UPI001E5A680E|nr:LytTR family DNA-binding domain-containing protein [Massilia antarctica]MCE3607801.1 LytTR family DNA-binding domain-containing protein [Massilia antarctica]